MRRKLLSFFLLLALLVCAAAVCLSASSSGQLRALASAGRSLLFETENVTLRGHADFRLEGVRFKSADILYMQDGTDSHWQLDLFTPRPRRSDRKTGYTVIANGGYLYSMEHYTPGVYAEGTDDPCSVLVRSTPASDLLLSMAEALADPVESLLPEGALEPAGGEGTAFRLRLSRQDVPAPLDSLMNLAARFALRRFMGLDPDTVSPYASDPFSDFASETQAILCTTDAYALSGVDLSFRLDDRGRLAAVSGSVSVVLLSRYQPERTVSVDLDLSVSDYGSTFVRAFDPEAFGVVPVGSPSAPEELWTVTGPLADQQEALALRALEDAGCSLSGLENPAVTLEDGIYIVIWNIPGEYSTVSVWLNEEGSLLYLCDGRVVDRLGSPRESVAPVSDDVREKLGTFVSARFPALQPECAGFDPLMVFESEGSQYLSLSGQDASGAYTGVRFIIRKAPLSVVLFDCLPEE